MGPQLYRCGNSGTLRHLRRPNQASMGPQLYRCGNKSRVRIMGRPSTLQWGRNFIVAETCLDGFVLRLGVVASMGPQLYRCGNHLLQHRLSSLKLMLQWGRNFIVAETSVIIRVGIQWGLASMGPQLYRCGNWRLTRHWCSHGTRFNGAATLSLRKLPSAFRTNFILRLASMGPQLYRCGNVSGDRKDSRGIWLQWGRNFIVAETRVFSRSRWSWTGGFNGAATLSLRKPASSAAAAGHGQVASMGPQLYRCGNSILCRDCAAPFRPLQWGRNFIVAETSVGQG